MWNIDNIKEAAENTDSIRQCLHMLGKSDHSHNYRKLRELASAHDIDLPSGNGHGGGQNRKPLEEILIKDSSYRSASLKQRLVAIGLLENECASCGVGPEWQGQPLTLQLDHINGDSTDHRLENLRILCPNCHSQTKTYSVAKDTGSKPINTCVDCDTNISRTATRCIPHAIEARDYQPPTKIDWPPIEELASRVEGASKAAVARELGVSDVAVGKRLNNHGP